MKREGKRKGGVEGKGNREKKKIMERGRDYPQH